MTLRLAFQTFGRFLFALTDSFSKMLADRAWRFHAVPSAFVPVDGFLMATETCSMIQFGA